MSLPLETFILAPLQEPLETFVAKRMEALDNLKPATKSLVGKWKNAFTHDLEQDGLAANVASWFSQCLGCDAQLLGAGEVMIHFPDVQWLRHTDQASDLRQLFIAMQDTASRQLFGENQTQNMQHNLLEDLMAWHTEEPEEYGVDEDPASQPQLSSPPSQSTPAEPTSMTWAEFEEIVKPQTWSKALTMNSHLWSRLCQSWEIQLRETFHLAQNSRSSDKQDPHYSSVVEVLREMRRVPGRVYRSPEWQSAVRKSKLPAAIVTWSHPQALALWRSPLQERLLRFHRINYTLFFVLWGWVPEDHILAEVEPSLADGLRTYQIHAVKASLVLEDGRDVFRFLIKNPKAIPLASSPSSAYFLLSLENFLEAWRDWLLCAIQSAGYDASHLYEAGVLKKDLFTEVSTALQERIQRGLDVIEDPRLRVILDRSSRFCRMRAVLAPKGGGILGREDRSNVTTACSRCKGKKPCVQDLKVRVKTPGNHLAGCGISAYPLEEVVDQSVRTHGAAIKPVLHPERDLNLKLIECDEEVVRRCGSQTFRLIDEETGELRDFWIYNAFSDTSLQTLQGHVGRFSALKSLVRGQQFATFSQGKMCPFGERTATGGAPGDSHRFYDTMSALNEDALECLFDHAEDSLILLQTTRLVAPGIHKQIRDSTREGEKLGLDAATIYYCSSYAAPFHIDNDVIPGVCALLEREAGKDDYCFVNLAYGYRFAPRANSFWSFRGTDLHGTSLPPLRLRGGKSCTLHLSKPKRNDRATTRYATARKVRRSVEQFWTAETDGV